MYSNNVLLNACTKTVWNLVLPQHYQAEESLEIRDSSLHLFNASVDKWKELWKPLKMEFHERTLREIPKVYGPLKQIKLNDLPIRKIKGLILLRGR